MLKFLLQIWLHHYMEIIKFGIMIIMIMLNDMKI